MTEHFDPLDVYLAIAEKYELIVSRSRAIEFLTKELVNQPFAALDLETTALSPTVGEVRLTQIHFGGRAVVIDHFLAGSFKELIKYFPRSTCYVVYNSKFETRWFDHSAPQEFDLLDVDFMAKCKLGGYPSSLARMCQRDLGIDMDKTLQTSDWSALKLTGQQYLYAALDAVVTWALFEYWWDELKDENDEIPEARWNGIDVFNDAVRATIEAEETGLELDTNWHMRNIRMWQRKQAVCFKTLRRFTPQSVINNLNSKKQISDFLKTQLDKESLLAWPKTGKKEDLSLEQKMLRPIQAKAPYPFSRWLIALIQFNYYSKYLNTYGEKLVNHQNLGGRIPSRFNIGQAATGRYSSSSENLQNIPRKVVVRKAFCGDLQRNRLMVLADYSGIEIRVLAELSQDKQLLQDAIYGDVHAGSAAAIYGIPLEEIIAVLDDKSHRLYNQYKELRSKAKGFTFQLLYGAGAAALSVVLKCSVDEAQDAIVKWAKRYPRAYHYRNVIFDEMNRTGFIPVCDGRTIYVRRADRTLPVAANYGIQGAAASVMYRAMYHVGNGLWSYREKEKWRGCIAATVHDELLLYSTKQDAEKVYEIMSKGMVQGWLDIFPNTDTHNLIDAVISDWDKIPEEYRNTWAAKP